jgi:tRNA threonylcarbamoyl adenosine modification protein YeaZ
VRCLFIDLASHQGLLACVTENDVQRTVLVDHRIADRELVPMVEKLLLDAKCSYKDLTNIACVVGPGGFMSLRVGVSLANTLSHMLKIPIAGIHLSELCLARSRSTTPVHPFDKLRAGQSLVASLFWLHSTKKDSLFVRSFGADFPQWKEPTHVGLQEFLSSVAGVHENQLVVVSQSPVHESPVAFFGELIPEHREAIENLQKSGIAIHELQLRNEEEVLSSFLSHVPYHMSHLYPWYGRGW